MSGIDNVIVSYSPYVNSRVLAAKFRRKALIARVAAVSLTAVMVCSAAFFGVRIINLFKEEQLWFAVLSALGALVLFGLTVTVWWSSKSLEKKRLSIEDDSLIYTSKQLRSVGVNLANMDYILSVIKKRGHEVSDDAPPVMAYDGNQCVDVSFNAQDDTVTLRERRLS